MIQTAVSKVTVLMLMLLMAGCGEGPPPERPLEERVAEYWQKQLDRDINGLYDFATPGFRQTMSREDFARDRSRRPVRWRNIRMIGADCQGDACVVKLRGEYQAVGAPSGLGGMRVPREFSERWIRVEGQWWRVENE